MTICSCPSQGCRSSLVLRHLCMFDILVPDSPSFTSSVNQHAHWCQAKGLSAERSSFMHTIKASVHVTEDKIHKRDTII